MMILASLVMIGPLVMDDGSAFRFRDEAEVDGRPVVVFRPIDLVDEPSRPLRWDEPMPEGTRFGLARVGRSPEAALAVAWDAGGRTLWIDADADGRLAPDERHALGSGEEVAVAVTIIDEDEDGGPRDRTLLVRPGLLGGPPRWAVRGFMEGTVTIDGEPKRALLVDGDADGCFATPGVDRAWIDLDGDGRFGPATEQFPIGAPIKAGATSYTIATDPWGRSVRLVERDPRAGRIVLTIGGEAATSRIDRVAAHLVNRSGELATARVIGEAVEVPVGSYRLSSFELAIEDERGLVWTYTFSGGWEYAIDVEADQQVEVPLIDGLELDVRAFSHLAVRPGGQVDVTPRLTLASGLYLSNCTASRPGIRSPPGRSASIVLKGPDGSSLDRSVSGFT